jgi:histidine decarboxylase
MFDISKAVSPYKNFCLGYGNSETSANSYLVGLTFGVGKSRITLNHEGSKNLDEINVFDIAEASGAYMGQINMVTVSSFCGPMGAIVGYDIFRQNKLFKAHRFFPEGKILFRKNKIPVFSASPLVEATKKIFGTVDDRKFPIIPGSIVPCATKDIVKEGPVHIYSGFGVGIAKDHKKDAHLFMEDKGEIPLHVQGEEIEFEYKHKILENIAKSIVEIGKNQRVFYKEILVEMVDVIVQPGEIGCALVAAPYFTLAKNAIDL